jgi:hypothetical protein
MFQGIKNEEDLPAAVLNQLTKDDDSTAMPADLQNVDNINIKQSNLSSTTSFNAPQSSDSSASDTIVHLDGVFNSVVTISSSQKPCSSEDMTVNEEATQSFDETSTSNLGPVNSAHLTIRKRAQESYLLNANKRIKTRNQYVEELWSTCSVGDYIGIKIDKVGRTNTDTKILPSIIIFQKFTS